MIYWFLYKSLNKNLTEQEKQFKTFAYGTPIYIILYMISESKWGKENFGFLSKNFWYILVMDLITFGYTFMDKEKKQIYLPDFDSAIESEQRRFYNSAQPEWLESANNNFQKVQKGLEQVNNFQQNPVSTLFNWGKQEDLNNYKPRGSIYSTGKESEKQILSILTSSDNKKKKKKKSRK